MSRTLKIPPSWPQGADCADCEHLFSLLCVTCEHANKILNASEDPIKSRELQRWMRGSLDSAH